jgi:ribonucleoside-diphosphate reductase alpha chain
VLSGEFPIVNKHLLKDLVKMGIWNDNMKSKIIAANGSVQNIAEIPQDIKDIYKTVWEIKQRAIIDMAADRGAYICQSQSLNLFIQDANFAKLTSMHFYAWKKGLKTGMYYLRTKSAADAIKFTIDTGMMKQTADDATAAEDLRLEVAAAKAEAAVVANGHATATITKEEAFDQMSCSLDDPDNCLACGS